MPRRPRRNPAPRWRRRKRGGDGTPYPMSNARRWSIGTVISATGIVYGDIGTSPLYALEQSLSAAGPFDSEAVLGILSLIFWALAISVTLKYVTVIMRADNDGEGGILALFALATRKLHG